MVTNNNSDGVVFKECWIATNTRFSKDAVTYGNCAGLKLFSWDYPLKGGLKELVSLSGYTNLIHKALYISYF
jgi:hypothetical protein